MGTLTLILIAIIVLAIIGLGFEVFFSGVVMGIQKIEENVIVKSIINQANNLAFEIMGSIIDSVMTSAV